MKRKEQEELMNAKKIRGERYSHSEPIFRKVNGTEWCRVTQRETAAFFQHLGLTDNCFVLVNVSEFDSYGKILRFNLPKSLSQVPEGKKKTMKISKGKGDCETCPELHKNIEELKQKLMLKIPLKLNISTYLGRCDAYLTLIRNFLLVLWSEEKLWLKALPQQLF